MEKLVNLLQVTRPISDWWKNFEINSLEITFHIMLDFANIIKRIGEFMRKGRTRRTSSFLPKPSKWLEHGLYLFLPKEQRECVIGDLEEEYCKVVFPKFGKRAADIWYAKQVMSSILPVVQARLVKLIGWATGGLGLGSAVEWFRKWSGGD